MVEIIKKLLQRQRCVVDYKREHSINAKQGNRKLTISTTFRNITEKHTLYYYNSILLRSVKLKMAQPQNINYLSAPTTKEDRNRT